jgi:catechol 2,3-dioxygenase-like lactoylglutathione lyase family enzyme
MTLDAETAVSARLDSLGALHHFGMTVSDIERSVAFYSEHFGLTYIGGNRFEGETISAQTGLPGTVLQTALLAGPNTIVEFLQYDSPEGVSQAPRPCDVGAAHACIVVQSIDEVLARMRAAGHSPHAQPCALVENTRMVYVRDPDGILIELLEPSPVIMLSTLLPSATGDPGAGEATETVPRQPDSCQTPTKRRNDEQRSDRSSESVDRGVQQQQTGRDPRTLRR